MFSRFTEILPNRATISPREYLRSSGRCDNQLCCDDSAFFDMKEACRWVVSGGVFEGGGEASRGWKRENLNGLEVKTGTASDTGASHLGALPPCRTTSHEVEMKVSDSHSLDRRTLRASRCSGLVLRPSCSTRLWAIRCSLFRRAQHCPDTIPESKWLSWTLCGFSLDDLT